MVTTFDLDEYVYGALRGEAVRAAHAGDALISPSITLRLLRHVTAITPRRAGAAKALSERETEVVRALAQGRTNQEIAAELFVSLSTVKSHLTGIQHKRPDVLASQWLHRTFRSSANRRQ